MMVPKNKKFLLARTSSQCSFPNWAKPDELKPRILVRVFAFGFAFIDVPPKRYYPPVQWSK
jgi:hypothetical protein